MIYDSLKIVFYVLLCLPVPVIGCYFVVLLIRDVKRIAYADKKKRDEKAAEIENRRLFDEKYEGKHKNV